MAAVNVFQDSTIRSAYLAKERVSGQSGNATSDVIVNFQNLFSMAGQFTNTSFEEPKTQVVSLRKPTQAEPYHGFHGVSNHRHDGDTIWGDG
jgi:hypothetical protein